MRLKSFGKNLVIDIDEILSVRFWEGGYPASTIIHYRDGLIDEFCREPAECCMDERESFDLFRQWALNQDCDTTENADK